MRGRRPVGPEFADRQNGTVRARLRMRVILETLAGTMSVKGACEQLRICSQRFEEIRATAIRAGIAALEPKPLGRPRRVERDPEIARLEARVAELEAELSVARVRGELAEHLPRRRARVAGKVRPRSNRAKESHRSRPGNTPTSD